MNSEERDRYVNYAKVVAKISDSIHNFKAEEFGWDMGPIIDDEPTDTQVVVLRRPGEVGIFIPCTQSLDDAKRDVRFGMTTFLVGRAHEGCAEAANKVLEKVEVAITAILQKDDRVTLIGYSLGGGLVNLLCLLLQPKIKRDVYVVTFGAMKVCDRDLAVLWQWLMEGRSAQFIYRDDIVTHVPFTGAKWPFPAYSRVHGKIFLNENGLVKHPGATKLWSKIKDKIAYAMTWVRIAWLRSKFSDHNIRKYIAALEKI